MEEMTYDKVVELERNIKIKNKAKELVEGFKRNVVLNLRQKNGLKFKIWSDEHNATYVEVDEKIILFICSFLHEHYSINVSEGSVYSGISNGDKVIDHLSSYAKVDYNSYNYRKD